MRSLKESLLDDENVLMDNTGKIGVINNIYKNYTSKKGDRDRDSLGKEVKEGDYVISSTIRGKLVIGIVYKINSFNNACAVSLVGDGSDLRQAASGEYVTNIPINQVIKIDKDIINKLIK